MASNEMSCGEIKNPGRAGGSTVLAAVADNITASLINAQLGAEYNVILLNNGSDAVKAVSLTFSDLIIVHETLQDISGLKLV
jgi:DNA-binding NtrC family response regulator